MTAHKHAALMMQYAQDAAETDEPWERWEYKNPSATDWHQCGPHFLDWDDGDEYRRKPQTITCNGFEVEAPLRKVDDHATYYLSKPESIDWYAASIFECYDEMHETRLVHGLIHATREGAIAHAKAMCGIDPSAHE